jgi:hypothetical protein
MKTLPKEITVKFFVNGQKGYDELERRWKKHIYSFDGTDFDKSHFLLYQILRGKELNKAFVFPTNTREIAEGRQIKINSYTIANAPIHHYIFKGLISIKMSDLYKVVEFTPEKAQYRELDQIKELLRFGFK